MDREEQGQTGSCKHILELRSILHVSSYDVYVMWEELVVFHHGIQQLDKLKKNPGEDGAAASLLLPHASVLSQLISENVQELQKHLPLPFKGGRQYRSSKFHFHALNLVQFCFSWYVLFIMSMNYTGRVGYIMCAAVQTENVGPLGQNSRKTAFLSFTVFFYICHGVHYLLLNAAFPNLWDTHKV